MSAIDKYHFQYRCYRHFSTGVDSDSILATTDSKTIARVDLQLSVVDQGPGIDPQDQTHLFNRFTRLKKNASSFGAGLGLNFVATVVKKHQGKITIGSELNVGSNFTIHLPALNERDLLDY